jgi:uncharacterized coiled-coil protein SlyX
MLIGFFIIGASFLYSITRLKPLEQQIAQKQVEIDKKSLELKQLDEKITQANNELSEINNKLAVAKDAFTKTEESLKKIAGGVKDPAAEARRTLQVVSKAADIVDSTGPPILPPVVTPQSLDGTTWNYSKGSVRYVIRFLPSGRYRYQNERGQWFDGLWVQSGRTVNIVTSNGSERETGTITGNRIQGRGLDELGGTWTWTATKSNR